MLQAFLQELKIRREQLGMTWEVLAERSGLSRATVCRLLSGKQTDASFNHVAALAKVLGMGIGFQPLESVEELIEKQARQQARRVFGLVQGTMGLESQAIEDEQTAARLIDNSFRRFLNGSRRKLWG